MFLCIFTRIFQFLAIRWSPESFVLFFDLWRIFRFVCFLFILFLLPNFCMDDNLSWQSPLGKIFKETTIIFIFLSSKCKKNASVFQLSKPLFFYTNKAKTYTYMNLCIDIFMQREVGSIWNTCYTPSKPPDHPARRTTELCGTWGSPGT